MRKMGLSLFICLTIISVVFMENPTSAQEARTRYLISFQGPIDYELIHALEGRIVREYQGMTIAAVEMSERKAQQLNQYPQVEFYEPDIEIKALPEIGPSALSDMPSSDQTPLSLPQSEQVVPWGIEKVNAMSAQEKGLTGKGIKVGIIDSGIDYTHEDLQVSGGISFVEGSPDYRDEYGHGTSVAGIIGARNNNIGVIGAAPGARLYAIKVLDAQGEGYISSVVSGIEWAINNKMNIVNMSLETATDSKALRKVVKLAYKKGILLVSAAGNNGFNEGDTIAYPAAYKEVIAVGAINSRDERAFYSGAGKDLELMAPGSSIYSTSINNQYSMSLGTSMASSHVAGVAALLWQAKPHLTNKEIRDILDKTAAGMGEKRLYGHGLVDAYKAINVRTK